MEEELSKVLWENAPQGVCGFTTKRYGGFSEGCYSGLNLGMNTEDNKKNILKNYKLLEFYTGLNSIGITEQVHGNHVLEINQDNFCKMYLEKADGLFTTVKNIPLGVQTADCFPVLLAGEVGIAALHCGWRSLNGGIVENALKLFNKYGDTPKFAYIGPGICADCYEIRDDMANILNEKYDPKSCLTPIGKGVYKFDLRKTVANALSVNGIRFIEDSGYTSCHSEGFYSYRRDKGATGRMLSVAVRSDN